MTRISYPRRQQWARLERATAALVLAALAGVLAVAAVDHGAPGPAAALAIAATGLVAYAQRWARLAQRSAVGARSERQVRQVLAPLRAEGWRLRHALRWDGRGDIDHVAIAPRAGGLAFVIETKTRTYSADQLAHRRPRALGGLAPAAMVSTRSVARAVRHAAQRHPAEGGRCPGGIDRPVDRGAAGPRGRLDTARVPGAGRARR